MANSTIGRMEEYYEWQDWNVYYERLEQFFEVNDIPEEKKVGVLISVIGMYSYKILRDLCHTVLPKEKTFEELCELMKRNCCPQVSIFRERIKFYRALQQPEEGILPWYRRIKSLSVDCKFGDTLEAVLLDKFVTGLRPGPILDRLCEEKETVTLQKALEIALNKEASLEKCEKPLNPWEKPQICPPFVPCDGVDECDNVDDNRKNEDFDDKSDSGHGTVILECGTNRIPEGAICGKPFQPPVEHEQAPCNLFEKSEVKNFANPVETVAPTNEALKLNDDEALGGSAPPVAHMRKAMAPKVNQKITVPEPIVEPAAQAEVVPTMMSAMQPVTLVTGVPTPMPITGDVFVAPPPIRTMMAPPAVAQRQNQRRKRGCRGGQRRNRNNQTEVHF